MPRQSPWLATFRRNDVDVEVSGILAAERDQSSVRREVRVRGLSLEARKPSRAAAGSWCDPNVVCVSETDLGRADCRCAQESSLASVSVLRSGFWRKNQKTEEQGERERDAAGHAMCPPRLWAEKGRHYRSNRSDKTYRAYIEFSIRCRIPVKPIHEEKDHEFPEA